MKQKNETILNAAPPFKLVDDSLERWDNQLEAENAVWQYFDKTIAYEIVDNQLKNPTSFAEFYSKLAIARGKCEWMKQVIKKENKEFSETLVEELRSSLVIDFPKLFAEYQFGGSVEYNITPQIGSKRVTALTQKYFEKLEFLFDANIDIEIPMGLSKICRTNITRDLEHPGYLDVLTFLEPCYQQLCSVDNLFTWLTIAARMMFMLSNFPPVLRGSLSVNCQIINKIARKKFNSTANFIPCLVDWIAYFETLDQYITFFVISSVTEYLKSLQIHGIEAFELERIILESPSVTLPTDCKKNLWAKLKRIMQNALAFQSILQVQDQKNLVSLLEGNLEFYQTSEKMTTLAQSKTTSIKKYVSLIPDEDKLYFKALLKQSRSMIPALVAAFGKAEEEKQLASLWQDILFIQIHTNDSIEVNIRTLPQDKNQYLILENPLCRWGFVEPKSFHQFSRLLELSEGFETEVAFALKNGLDLKKLNALIKKDECSRFFSKSLQMNEEVLQLLVSRAACLLYVLNKNIEPEHLLAQSVEEMEMKILNLVSLHYGGESLQNIDPPEIRETLLKYLDSYLLKQIKISQLVADTAEDTRKNILSAYIQYYDVLSSISMEGLEDTMIAIGLDNIVSHDRLTLSTVKSLFEIEIKQQWDPNDPW